MMKYLLTILTLILTSSSKGQVRDTVPMRVTFMNATGSIRTIQGFGILVSDTAMNRVHNVPEIDSLPHYVLPVAFLNARKKPVTNKIINFDYILK